MQVRWYLNLFNDVVVVRCTLVSPQAKTRPSAQQLNVMRIAGIFPTARFDHKSANLEADFSSHKSETTASAEFIALFEPAILKHHAASNAYADGVDPALREIEQM
jgi:hypothetical protein